MLPRIGDAEHEARVVFLLDPRLSMADWRGHQGLNVVWVRELCGLPLLKVPATILYNPRRKKVTEFVMGM